MNNDYSSFNTTTLFTLWTSEAVDSEVIRQLTLTQTSCNRCDDNTRDALSRFHSLTNFAHELHCEITSIFHTSQCSRLFNKVGLKLTDESINQ